MTPVTLFLAVLIVALLIGNGLLFLFTGRRVEAIEEVSAPVVINPPQGRSIAPLEKKIELAHKRIQVLEELGSAKSNEALKTKVHKLDNFRSTVEAELIAMKEILLELQNKHLTVKARLYRSKAGVVRKFAVAAKKTSSKTKSAPKTKRAASRSVKGRERALSSKDLHKLAFRSK